MLQTNSLFMGSDTSQRLTVYIDGASRGNPGPAGIGVYIKDERGSTELRVSSYIGEATNNEAEYRALIRALEEAVRLEADEVDIRSDSELVVRQVKGSYRVRKDNLKPLFQEAKHLLESFGAFAITHIPREQNATADALAGEAIEKHLRRQSVFKSGKLGW